MSKTNKFFLFVSYLLCGYCGIKALANFIKMSKDKQQHSFWNYLNLGIQFLITVLSGRYGVKSNLSNDQRQ